MKLVYFGMLWLTAVGVNAVYGHSEQDEAETDAAYFCKYFTGKNEAKRIGLQFPDAFVRFNNANEDTYDNRNFSKYVIVGLSKDVADFNKAKYVKQLIHEECTYYKLNLQAQLHVNYFIASVKAETAQFKLQQIHIAKNKLKSLLAIIQKRIHSGNDTLHTYYRVTASLNTLEEMAQGIHIDAATESIPKITRRPLLHLLNALTQSQNDRQKTLNWLEQQNNWSLRVEAGAQQTIDSSHGKKASPYLALSARYNLGAPISNQRYEQSLHDHMQWQKTQIIGTEHSLAKLIKTVAALKTRTQERLVTLQKNAHTSSTLRATLMASNSSNAVRFRQEIEIEAIMLGIEINCAKYLIALLE